jgi:hypothetical protein
MSERARLNSIPAASTDDAVMVRKYFTEAVTLDPSDARYLGFLAASILAEGGIHKDEKLTHEGYFMLRDSIQAWPEFNLFTAGYVMSQQPADSPRFREGLEWEWRNLDVCAQEKIDRANPDYSKYMSSETKEGQKRVCWNSWIAPHNFEGFFLNMGDMLVKSGNWQSAQRFMQTQSFRVSTGAGSSKVCWRIGLNKRKATSRYSMRQTKHREQES